VEGYQALGLGDDTANHGVEIRENVRRGKAQDAKTSLGKPNVPSGVSHRTIAAIVRLAIDLDDKSGFVAIKVGHVRA
jgi:hypothetical protein